MTARKVARFFGLGVAACLLFAVTWSLVLPVSDHRSLGYLLWKRSLADWLGDEAWLAFLHDTGRDEVVLGLTRAEVGQRFGVLLNEGNSVTPHQAYYEPHLKEVDHAWIGGTLWLLVFDSGRVCELNLCKG